jgi:hypothetical protein
MKKGRSFKIEDRMFSLSSTTSQAVRTQKHRGSGVEHHATDGCGDSLRPLVQAEELAIANAEAQVGTQRQKGQPGRPPRQYQD